MLPIILTSAIVLNSNIATIPALAQVQSTEMTTNQTASVDVGKSKESNEINLSEIAEQSSYQATTKAPKKASLNKVKLSGKKAVLSWKKQSDASGYEVYMSKTEHGTYKKIKTITNTSVTTYTTGTLANDTVYYFKIRAYRNAANGKKSYGAYSSFRSIARGKVKVNPAKLYSVTIKNKKAVLTWMRQDSVSGYVVYMAKSKNGPYKAIKGIKKCATTTYTTGKLAEGTTYYFKVRSYKNVSGKRVYGNYSGVKTVKRKKIEPVVCKVPSGKENKIKIGGRYIWYEFAKGICTSTSESGTEQILVAKPNEEFLDPSIICVGEQIYYGIINGNIGGKWSYFNYINLYKIDIDGTNKTYVGKIEEGQQRLFSDMGIVHYYKDKLYVNFSDYANLYVYECDLKTKQVKKKLEGTNIIYCDKNYMLGFSGIGYFFQCAKLVFWDLNTSSTITLSDNGAETVCIAGGRIYYIEGNKGDGSFSNYNCKVYSCKLDGSDKKQHGSSFVATMIMEITSEYVKYKDYNSGKDYKYYFTTGQKYPL